MLEPVNVIFYDKMDFAVVIKLGILRWGGYPGLSQWALNAITNILRDRQREIDKQNRAKSERELVPFWL